MKACNNANLGQSRAFIEFETDVWVIYSGMIIWVLFKSRITDLGIVQTT